MFRRRETETETKERLLKLTDHNGVDETDIYCPPAMDAQVALYELGNYLLGEGWYVVDPLSRFISPFVNE